MCAPGANAAELLAQLEHLQTSSSGGGYRGSTAAASEAAGGLAHGVAPADGLAELQAADLRAHGRIAVQLFLRCRLFLSSEEASAWDMQVLFDI